MEQIYSLEIYSYLANSWPCRNKMFLSCVCNRPLLVHQTWRNFCVKPHHDNALDTAVPTLSDSSYYFHPYNSSGMFAVQLYLCGYIFVFIQQTLW